MDFITQKTGNLGSTDFELLNNITKEKGQEGSKIFDTILIFMVKNQQLE